MIPRKATFVGVGALLALTGCAEMNLGSGAFTADRDIARAEGTSASNAFNEALRQDYLSFAKYERDVEYDWRDAGFHGAKAVQAANNETPEISPSEHWMLPAGTEGRFKDGLASLQAAFADGAREKQPTLASRAQTFFECWAEEQEENWQTDRIAYCWSSFESTMAALQEALKPKPEAAQPAPAPKPAAVAEPPASDYLVFFDFDRTEIRSDSAGILDRVVEAYQALKGQVVTLIGHADRAGPSTYNQGLSVRRAVAVRDYLVDQGIRATAITTDGRGEDDPRVPTPDGVREQENRRVEIHIK